MVKLGLFLTATLDGVTNLAPARSDNEYYYAFEVNCSSCRETHPNYVHVSAHEKSDMSGSRGEANFVWKCKNCGREASANLDDSITPYNIESSGTKNCVLTFETRGCEFTNFKADGEWTCQGSEGKRKASFTGVDLSEGEWYDYDDAAGAEVSITEVEWTIGRV